MIRRAFRVLSVISTVALASCAAPAPPPAAPPAPATPAPIEKAAVDAILADITAALNSGDAAKAGTMYEPDASFISARGKVDTAKGIEQFWAKTLAAPGASKDLKLELVSWGTSGDLVYTVSRFTGGFTAASGYTVAVSRRQADGSLKIATQMSLPDPPAAK